VLRIEVIKTFQTFTAFASHYHLDNLVAIIDVNRLGQSEATMIGHDLDVYARRMEAFGFHAIIVDGHSVNELVQAFATARATKGRPTAIIAKTFKGLEVEHDELRQFIRT
jgi:transketolase